MHQRGIKRFEIYGLHGERNVRLNFENQIKILVAENGYGKTTILNSMYALLSKNFNKLRKMPFESICVEFVSGDCFEISSDELAISPRDVRSSTRFNRWTQELSASHINKLSDDYRHMSEEQFIRSSAFRAAVSQLRAPSSTVLEWLSHLLNNHQLSFVEGKLSEVTGIIDKNFYSDILYLPTYRRIEEDLLNLGLNPEGSKFDRVSIQFGMKDIEERFQRITSEIQVSSIEWFSKVNGEMLGQLVDGINITDEMKKSLRDPDALKIVLDRIGENISHNHKTHILELLLTDKIFSDEYKHLAHFVCNLIKVYEQQRDKDNAIKAFTEVCNAYLVDKKVVYNESTVSIAIVRKKNSRVVDIEKLSSGEKQVISLFSKLYLDSTGIEAIFFDEPELSLSMEWQKQLIPHIIKSGKCGFILVTTHSPFIFDNDLASLVTGLDQCIEEL